MSRVGNPGALAEVHDSRFAKGDGPVSRLLGSQKK